MSAPFVGVSYALALRKADIQRAVNLYLVGLEMPGKAPFIMDSVPGRILRIALGAEIRGAVSALGRAFVVAGNTLYEIFSNWTYTARGTLQTSTGPVAMEYGLFQVVMVDGNHGYVLTMATNALAQITSAGFYGSSSLGFIANCFTFIRPDSQQFELSAINDATSVDALDFASAEVSPDNLVGHIIDHEEAWLFGELTTEVWGLTGAADFPLSKRGGATMEVGLMAAQSLCKIDNSVFWIGRDKNGAGMVYRAQVYQPVRITTQAVEQALQASTDLSQARAFCYQQGGLTFYAINAPGLASTWVYEVSTGAWHERCSLDSSGQLVADTPVVALFAFDKHLVGDADGNILELDKDTYTLNGEPLVRMRISPHEAIPGRVRQFFSAFFLDCTTGEAPQGVDPHVELSYSNDSGATWSSPVLRSIGQVGRRVARVLWTRLGMSRDRVWKLVFSGNAPFAIYDAGADSEAGHG